MKPIFLFCGENSKCNYYANSRDRVIVARFARFFTVKSRYNNKKGVMHINPPIYKTAEELEAKVNEYFEYCKGERAKDKDGKYIYNRWNEPVYDREPVPPCMTRLSLYLGFRSRQALANYRKRSKAFAEVIEYAKSCCEAYNEERLYDKNGFNGARMNLTVNYGWREPESNTDTVSRVVIVNDIPDKTD